MIDIEIMKTHRRTVHSLESLADYLCEQDAIFDTGPVVDDADESSWVFSDRTVAALRIVQKLLAVVDSDLNGFVDDKGWTWKRVSS